MSNSNEYSLTIDDLPNEILLKIFRKLNMIDVFYSISNVSQKFRRLALDCVYVRDLEMTTMMNIDTFYKEISTIDPKIIGTICENILPQIADQVHKLTVDQITMTPILHAVNYPELYSLSIVNIQEEIFLECLENDLILRGLLQQTVNLNIDIKYKISFVANIALDILQLITTLCTNLTVLNFGDMIFSRKRVLPLNEMRSKNNTHSRLTKLKINVRDFYDLVCVLDGRFECLSNLIVTVSDHYSPTDIHGTKHLSKLKLFSLIGSTNCPTFRYDSFIVPLLRGMINIAELQLCLRVVRCKSTFIDGNQLYDQFLVYMTRLTKFTFDIMTNVHNKNIEIQLPSNEDIQRSFLTTVYQQVFSYVNKNPIEWDAECRFYSLPYDFEYIFDFDKSFSTGTFPKVQQIEMRDRVPFKYKLFQRISQDFPFLKYLYVLNRSSIKDKPHLFTLIVFPHLKYLDLDYAHCHYALLFLLKKNSHLPNLAHLCILEKSLKKITKNFTKNAIHFNFDTLKNLDVGPLFVPPKKFHAYFPVLSMYK